MRTSFILIPFLVSLPVLISDAWALDGAPLLPPDMEYGKNCKPSDIETLRFDPRVKGRNIAALNLPAKTIYQQAKLLLRGNASVAQDDREAATLFEYLTRQPSRYRARAQYYLAGLYLNGKGVQQDRETARALYAQALSEGAANAAYKLGEMALDAGNKDQAGSYFLLGATRNHLPSALAMAHLYTTGDIASPTPEAARNMATLAHSLLLERLARGSCGMLYGIGMLYHHGTIVPVDEKVAYQWFAAAAQAGDTRAMLRLAKHYMAQNNAEMKAKAILLLKRAAGKGMTQAQEELGEAYLYGRGVNKDETAAVEWLERAAIKPDASAATFVTLGRLYALGDGTSQDLPKALKMYEKAALLNASSPPISDRQDMRALEKKAQQGDAEAMFELGNHYSAGDGVPYSMQEAKQWWKKSAAAGHATANALLEHLGE